MCERLTDAPSGDVASERERAMFFFNRFQPQPAERRPYSRVLRCYSVAFNVETHADIAEVNSGGKIFLPQSALEYLRLPSPFPFFHSF